MRKYGRTAPEKEAAVLERYQLGMGWKAIELETGVPMSTCFRIAKGHPRGRVDPLLLPHDRLWYKSEDIYRVVLTFISREELTERIASTPSGSSRDKFWRRVEHWVETNGEKGLEWARLDATDTFFTWLGLHLNELPEPVFTGWDKMEMKDPSAYSRS